MKIVFLEKNSLGDDVDVSEFARFGELEVYPFSTNQETLERVRDADAVFSNKIMMNEETLGEAPKLKYIGITATGTNNVDMEYVKSRGSDECGRIFHRRGGAAYLCPVILSFREAEIL